MKRIAVCLLVVFGLTCGMVSVGCSEKAKEQTTTTKSGPGGTTTEKETKETTKSGENPPPTGKEP